MEYLQSIYKRYHQSSRKQKSQILEEFCKVCKYNRKYAIRLLNAPLPEKKSRGQRSRPFHYSHTALSILEAIWKASGTLCSQRLKAALPLWIPYARSRFRMTPELEREIVSISARQIDNRLRDKKRQMKKRIYCTTRPGTLLKSKIPIRTHNWDIRLPGYLEMDLVAHCGNSNAGQFIYTLNATDIQTGWTERVAVMGKGQRGILAGMSEIKNRLPFRLRGMDSDNGEEFINDHLLNFCFQFKPRIEFTRGRPYKKDDNAHVEQKNWTHVRQIFGWDRYESEEAQKAMNDLYLNELRLFQNLFQPSMKLRKKVRVGSKLVRKYDLAQTPFQRVLKSGKYNKAKVKKLKELFETLDPFELSCAIDQKLQRIFKMASERIRASQKVKGDHKQALKSPQLSSNDLSHITTSPKEKSPWRDWTFSKKIARRKKIMAKALYKPFKEAA
jgi:hypothetical protein